MQRRFSYPTHRHSQYRLRSQSRPALSGDLTLYVRTDGDDSNDGLSNTSGGALATIQEGVNRVARYDLNGYNAYILVGTGTFNISSTINLISVVGARSASRPIILGSASSPYTKLSGSATLFLASNPFSYWVVGSLNLTTSSGHIFRVQRSAFLRLENLNGGPLVMGPASGTHFLTEDGGVLEVASNYTVNGKFDNHWWASVNSRIVAGGRTVTLGTGANLPDFSTWGVASRLSFLNTYGTDFTGGTPITGRKYVADNNGVIYSGGKTYPGSVAGVTSSGGIYS